MLPLLRHGCASLRRSPTLAVAIIATRYTCDLALLRKNEGALCRSNSNIDETLVVPSGI